MIPARILCARCMEEVLVLPDGLDRLVLVTLKEERERERERLVALEMKLFFVRGATQQTKRQEG